MAYTAEGGGPPPSPLERPVRLTLSSWFLVVTVTVLGAVVYASVLRGGAGTATVPQAAARAVPEYTYKVVKVYPHDPHAFTQGLEFRAGVLYEGTGLHGQSSLRKVKLETGEVLQKADMAQEYFGEGITVLNERIVHLTYKTEVGFVHDQASFKVLRQFSYPGEGWGLTNDSARIFMSDGSAQVRIWDPVSLGEIQRLTVKDGSHEVDQLNELEYVRDEIYANVWQTFKIVRFSPKDGRVTGWIDLTGILPAADRANADVLNGIAYDPIGDRLFVTGKLWPKLFEIKLVPRTRPTRS